MGGEEGGDGSRWLVSSYPKLSPRAQSEGRGMVGWGECLFAVQSFAFSSVVLPASTALPVEAGGQKFKVILGLSKSEVSLCFMRHCLENSKGSLGWG